MNNKKIKPIKKFITCERANQIIVDYREKKYSYRQIEKELSRVYKSPRTGRPLTMDAIEVRYSKLKETVKSANVKSHVKKKTKSKDPIKDVRAILAYPDHMMSPEQKLSDIARAVG